MTHTEIERLASDYLEGHLDKASHERLEEHLRGCSPCREILADIRLSIETCRSASAAEPPPWLLLQIRRATVGNARLGFSGRLRAVIGYIRQPRIAYSVGMALFSISLLANIAGLNLRGLKLKDLSASTWVYRMNRAGHLLYARAERFCNDLQIVYEIESRFRNAKSPSTDREERTSYPAMAPPAGTANTWKQRMEFASAVTVAEYAQFEPGVRTHEMR